MSKQPGPIPHDWGVAPCLDLINSRWRDHLGSGAWYDRLSHERFRTAFLKRWRYDTDVAYDWAELGRLRDFLRVVLENYSKGRGLTPAMRRRLYGEMNRTRISLQLVPAGGSVQLREQRSGPARDAILAEIATSAARLLSEGRSIKVCANPNCSWMFVDESRPGTRRWCNTGVCGNLVNSRRFRTVHGLG